jgi:thiosulfate/3-mercaptopyruvate sulfurtransferase
LGITPAHEVITYDPGTLFAARVWWVLSYLGHDRVSVLHGGVAAWDDAGGDVGQGDPTAEPVIAADAPYQSVPRPEMLAQLDQVRDALGDPTVAIVDARAPEEYAAGHIPGAVNLNYVRNAEAEPPRRWLPAAELLAMYEMIGVTPDKLVIPYCTSGVRSAVSFFTLQLLGYPNVALFTGSWQEWSARSDHPVTTGDQP